MNLIKKKIKGFAEKNHLQLIYAFGSRAKETLNLVKGKKPCRSLSKSDLDIGVKPERRLTVEDKVNISLFFEDIFDVPKVDVVVIPEAPISLAMEIVKGELLYAKNDTYEAEYQLYIMRRAAELIPYEKMKRELILRI